MFDYKHYKEERAEAIQSGALEEVPIHWSSVMRQDDDHQLTLERIMAGRVPYYGEDLLACGLNYIEDLERQVREDDWLVDTKPLWKYYKLQTQTFYELMNQKYQDYQDMVY